MLALLYACARLAFVMFRFARHGSRAASRRRSGSLARYVPLTSGLALHVRFEHMSMLWGIVFFSISRELLGWLGAAGSTNPGQLRSDVVGLDRARRVRRGDSWLIRERPVPRLVMAAAPS